MAKLNKNLTVKNYKILHSCFSNAKKEVKPVIKFIMLWVCFNHWYARYLKKDINKLKDKNCLDKIKVDYKLIARRFTGNLPRETEESFRKFAEIRKKITSFA